MNRPWQYRVTAQDAEDDQLTFSMEIAPDGMSIHPQSGVVTWVAPATSAPSQSIKIRVSDQQGAFVEQSFNLQVVAEASNLPPEFLSTPPLSALLNRTLLYPVDAVDPDGDPIVFSLLIKPEGMSIDSTTGLVSWSPNASQLGPSNVQLIADDGRGGQKTQSFTIEVLSERSNVSPQITSNPVIVAKQGIAYKYDPTAIDNDADSIIWSLDQAPRGMSIDERKGFVRWIPSASTKNQFR